MLRLPIRCLDGDLDADGGVLLAEDDVVGMGLISSTGEWEGRDLLIVDRFECEAVNNI